MLRVCHCSTCEVVILLALFHPARYGRPRYLAYVTLDPSSTLHLISDVLGQESIETFFILTSLDPLRAEINELAKMVSRNSFLPEEKAEIMIKLNTLAANTELVEPSTLQDIFSLALGFEQ